MICRLILPEWVKQDPTWRHSQTPATVERNLELEDVQRFNQENFYNCYFFPNYPSKFVDDGDPVQANDVDIFRYVFVDLDMKNYQDEDERKRHDYATKEEFIEVLKAFVVPPSLIIDSGNGVHAYWELIDLDAKSFLRLNRRLCRHFKTDEAVSKLNQLMRIPNTINTKDPDNLKRCEPVEAEGYQYTCEELDKVLPKITADDEQYCTDHYDRSYGTAATNTKVLDELPLKFWALVKQPEGSEVKELFFGRPKDRSAADFRLAHLLLASDFTREEAMTVLVNTSKASSRTQVHRYNYANDIIRKVYGTFEDAVTETEKTTTRSKLMSRSVKEILAANVDEDALRGKRFPCSPIVDATHYGFRLTQVLGLIGGSGSGKTTLALNYFYWFKKSNPEYIHVFVSLEQPEEEIASRWKTICGDNPALYDSVHVLGNYNKDGTFRNLSLAVIEDYIKTLEKETNQKVGCVVIDHIGALKKQGRNGENQDLMDICHSMKAFAVNTNTFLIMQSQTSREKAGAGDIELDKDAAYGTTLFEWYCDWVVTTWQPLKRVYDQEGAPTITVFKYCKIRHKKAKLDRIKEDVRYALYFDTDTERLREINELETKALNAWAPRANSIRNRDKKREPGVLTTVSWTKKESNGKADNH